MECLPDNVANANTFQNRLDNFWQSQDIV